MIRKAALIAPVTVALLALTACGGTTEPATEAQPSLAKLSAPLPPELESAKKIEVGIACDYPPFGFKDVDNKNSGYDADVARELARYAFNDPEAVNYTCVTPANRIPYLETNKIDIIVSTLGYTAERNKTIDYSTAYFTSGAKLLVKSESEIQGWDDVATETLITKQGTTSSTYIQQCLKDAEQLLLDSTSDAVTSLKQGRGAAFVEDSTLLLGLALTNKDVKVVGEDKATTPWGLGIKKGNAAMKTWVDAALADMKSNDSFYRIFKENIPNEEAQKVFAEAMPRPDRENIKYSDATEFTC